MKGITTLAVAFIVTSGALAPSEASARHRATDKMEEGQEARIVEEQERALMVAIALALESITSGRNLIELREQVSHPLLAKEGGRVSNILIVDASGRVIDSLDPRYNPVRAKSGTIKYSSLRDVSLPPLLGEPLTGGGTNVVNNRGVVAGAADPRALSLEVKTRQGLLRVIVALK